MAETTMLRIALLQLTAHGYDQAANLTKGEAACRHAKEMGADIALFPEMWNIGYTFEKPPHPGAGGGPGGGAQPAPSDEDIWRAPELWGPRRVDWLSDPAAQAALDRWRAQAIDRDGPFAAHFRALARELNLAIALTYLERWHGGDDGPRNTVSLIDRHGEVVLTYAKVHTCDFDLPEAALTPGDGFPVGTLDAAAGPVQVGAMICFDREFPESARLLMLAGAELILVPNSCDLEPLRLAQFRVRAAENAVGVAMANYPRPQCNGHSVAYHPIAFHHGQPRDTLVVEAGEAEGIYLAAFDLKELRDWRRRDGWGSPFRRPHRYGPLTSNDVPPVFVRENAAGERYDLTRRQV